jgi:hypothetical protein
MSRWVTRRLTAALKTELVTKVCSNCSLLPMLSLTLSLSEALAYAHFVLDVLTARDVSFTHFFETFSLLETFSFTYFARDIPTARDVPLCFSLEMFSMLEACSLAPLTHLYVLLISVTLLVLWL